MSFCIGLSVKRSTLLPSSVTGPPYTNRRQTCPPHSIIWGVGLLLWHFYFFFNFFTMDSLMFPNHFWYLIEGPLTSQPKFSSRQFFARPRPSPNLFIFRIRATLMLVFLPIEYFGGFSFWNFYTSHGTTGGKSRDWGGKQGWRVLMGPMVSHFGSRWSEWNERWNVH